MTCDSSPLVSLISNVAGGVSFASWLVALLPQLIETYRTKSVEGLSPVFVGVWFLGDIFSLIGCVLTDQMFFQYLLASYFLLNDFFMVGQYWYYGYYLKKHKHRHHQHQHHHQHSHHSIDPEYGSTSNVMSGAAAAARAVVPAVVIASQAGTSEARQLLSSTFSSTSALSPLLVSPENKIIIGTVFAWVSAALYFFSRLPQLWMNYKRKSTDDVSPFLFGCTLIGNASYAVSIMMSCEFISGDAKWEFFLKELPYMIGSAGTIIFDVLYFYQLWLYSDKTKIDEDQPLLSNS